jgi:hypothetical protein
VAHLLSGRQGFAGLAWVGALCNIRYGAGVSSGIGDAGSRLGWDGNQNNNPARVVWDVIVFAHELGHNFGSDHTQDYCNVGGVAGVSANGPQRRWRRDGLHACEGAACALHIAQGADCAHPNLLPPLPTPPPKPQPIDECVTPCNAANPKLPTCSAAPTAFRNPGGNGAGTIMSYCHKLDGGFGNTALVGLGAARG